MMAMRPVCRARASHRVWSGIALVLAVAAPVSAQLRLERYVAGLHAPLEFVQDPSTPSLQYILEQAGTIRVIQNGVLLPTPFLDLSLVISSGGERGLLGLAFPPDYGTSGRFFVDFTDPSGNTVVARFKRSAATPLVADASTRFDLRWGGTQRFIVQPFPNHNGGHLAFGPDGYLYVALGDGGSGDDPQNNSQNPQTFLGKLLRIDVSVADGDSDGYVVPGDNPFTDGSPVAALPEIWAFGLRNPWKFSFDSPTLGGSGAMLIGDVGQASYEEVDYQPPGIGGRNYGWRVREGAHAHIGSPGPAYMPLVDPITEYDHSVGSSITGGFVYRGMDLAPFYRGRYFFADFVKGRLWSISLLIGAGGEASASALVEHTAELGGTTNIGNVSAFGIDARGEMYVVSYSSGTIFKVVDTLPITTGVSDFDGDHKTDVAVWRPSTGAWSVVRSSDGGLTSRRWGLGYAPYYDVPVPGDYDGDGRTDIAVWDASGVWYVIPSSSGVAFARRWGVPGDRPVPGDYDGDGKTDFAVWHTATGYWDVLLSASGSVLRRLWGTAGPPYNDVPVPGDYDGDHKTDIAIWRASTGIWYVVRSSDGSVTTPRWGSGYPPYKDVPVPGDYDGDGRTDIAVWRASTGIWYVIHSSDASVLTRQWGDGEPPYNQVPVPGDYDGDGKTDIAVWSAFGPWYVVRSSDGVAYARRLGFGTDFPIP